MLLIHIAGCSCSGKTALIQSLEGRVASFDIRKDFYEKHGCLVDNVMDWKKWENTAPLLKKEFIEFVETNKSPLIIESSGINQQLDKIIDSLKMKGYSVHKIYLRIPSEEELKTRAKFRNVKSELVIDFAKMYRKRVCADKVYTLEEAREYILGLLRTEKENA